MNIDNKQLCNYILDLLSKLHSDYLLINRICYKVKHQFRRHRHFQYITQYKNILKKTFRPITITSKSTTTNTNDNIFSSILTSQYFTKPYISNIIISLLIKIGLLLNEMMKLKLYLPYCVVMLGIISRAHSIYEYVLNNNDVILSSANALNLCKINSNNI